MRVVSVQSGEVLTSVTTTTVYSASIQGNAFKYIAANELLQIEAGITRTEPTQLAVRQAIDLARAVLPYCFIESMVNGCRSVISSRRARDHLGCIAAFNEVYSASG